jgi:hypothetical protein
MLEIRRAIRQAGRRLIVSHFLRTASALVFAALCAVLLTRIAQRMLGFPVPWREVVIYAPVAVLALSLLWVLIRQKKELSVARELDERGNLKESLSTALCVEKASQTDPWAHAVVETARVQAVSVNVAHAIPIEAPKSWPYAMGAGVALVIAWFLVPNMDLLGMIARKEEAVKKQQEIGTAKAEVAAAEQKLQELLKKANVDVKDEEGSDADENMPAPQNAEEIRRAAVKKLESVTEKLQEKVDGEKGEKMEALRQQMQQLKQPGPGPLEEFSKQLAKGDFGKAEQALEQMSKALEQGQMSEDQKAQAKAQMENLAKQLQKLSQEKQAIANELAKAGMDPKKAQELAKKMATDPEAVKKAIEEMKNLTPEQKQQMQEMAKAMNEACKSGEQMSQAMQQMAQAMSKEGMGQQGSEAMQEMSQQLSELELASADLEAMERALSEAKGQLAKMCEGMGGQCEGDGSFLAWRDTASQWAQGDANKQGAGSGGPGQGMGAGPEESAADYKLDKVKASVQTRKGQIIGSRLVQGEQIRGESVAEFAEAVEASAKAATEAIEENQIPRELQGAVKHYFGRRQAEAQALLKDKKPEAAPPAPAPAPAPDATKK